MLKKTSSGYLLFRRRIELITRQPRITKTLRHLLIDTLSEKFITLKIGVLSETLVEVILSSSLVQTLDIGQGNFLKSNTVIMISPYIKT